MEIILQINIDFISSIHWNTLKNAYYKNGERDHLWLHIRQIMSLLTNPNKTSDHAFCLGVCSWMMTAIMPCYRLTKSSFGKRSWTWIPLMRYLPVTSFENIQTFLTDTYNEFSKIRNIEIWITYIGLNDWRQC